MTLGRACDRRCWRARSRTCRCVCGGAAHGSRPDLRPQARLRPCPLFDEFAADVGGSKCGSGVGSSACYTPVSISGGVDLKTVSNGE